MNFATYGIALRAILASITDSARLVLPNLLGAVALLAGGWLAALLLRRVTVRLSRRIDGFARRSNVDGALQRIGVQRPLSDVIGGFVFWTVFLFFVAGATEAFGLPVLSTWLTGVAFFLPRIAAALLVLLAGVLVANFAKGSAPCVLPRLHTYVLFQHCELSLDAAAFAHVDVFRQPVSRTHHVVPQAKAGVPRATIGPRRFGLHPVQQ